MFVNILFFFFFVGTDLNLLGRESVSESWIDKVVVVSLKTFVNILFCRNGSLGLEDSRILLEIELVGKSWVGRVVVFSENVHYRSFSFFFAGMAASLGNGTGR